MSEGLELRKTELFLKSPSFHVEAFGRRGYFAAENALSFVNALQDECVDLVFLDPPFNLGKAYDRRSTLESADPEKYALYMTKLLTDLARVLKPGGSLYFYHLPYWASKFAPTLHGLLQFRHWIAVMMKNGFARGNKLYPAHYALLYFSKGDPSAFSRPKLVPTQCRHCGDLIKDYGGYTSIIKEKGINLSDFWDDLSPVRHNKRKLRAANQLPEKLTDRVVQISGIRGGVFLDPFVGTGTSIVSAYRFGMNFLANDISRRCVRMSRNRLDQARLTEKADRRSQQRR